MLKLSEYRYKLDLYLPYYVTLRQSLIAKEFVTSVIDRDPGMAKNRWNRLPVRNTVVVFPENALVIGVELDSHAIWPEGLVCQENVADQKTFARVSEMLKNPKER